MGFTIEDMMVVSKKKYRMELLAGKNGWSNSISWILLIEDEKVLRNFKGKDLAITTGLGFDTEAKQLQLVKKLTEKHASGLIINTGQYIMEISERVVKFCDENDFPLLTVPWDIQLYDLIKDLNIRVFLQGVADEQISNALIRAIEEPEAVEVYQKDLLPYFDVDGTFQVVLVTTGELDSMDTVERRRLSYQLQIYLESITHNASFFYYDACFALIVNALTSRELEEILQGFVKRVRRKMPGRALWMGVGSAMKDITNLSLAYRRAKAAVEVARKTGQDILWYDQMGIYRILALIPDPQLKKEMGEEILRPILEYDQKHQAGYLETLEVYLQNNCSIQAVAEQTFTHRNTVIYRINNIKKMLNNTLDSSSARMEYLIACMLVRL